MEKAAVDDLDHLMVDAANSIRNCIDDIRAHGGKRIQFVANRLEADHERLRLGLDILHGRASKRVVAKLRRDRARHEQDAFKAVKMLEESPSRTAVIKHGRQVLSEWADWAREPHPALGGKTANSLLRTAKGRRQVMNLLHAIEYGVYL